jgi:hypothetical protein
VKPQDSASSQGSIKAIFSSLGLGLGSESLGLGLEGYCLGLGIGTYCLVNKSRLDNLTLVSFDNNIKVLALLLYWLLCAYWLLTYYHVAH